MAGGGNARSRSAWKRWWKEAGEVTFLESARNPPDIVIPENEEKASTERVATRARKVTQYFSKLRNQGLDIIFLLDVTMSMTDELLRMRQQVNEITSFMDLLLKGKVRMGFVTYGDDVVQAVPLTKKLGKFAREVETIKIFNDPNDRTIEEGVAKGSNSSSRARTSSAGERRPSAPCSSWETRPRSIRRPAATSRPWPATRDSRSTR